MGANPYVSNDDDSDILNPKPSGVSGQPTSPEDSRKKIIITGVDGKALPAELQGAINQYIDKNTAEFGGAVVTETLPIEFKSVAYAFDYFADHSVTCQSGPVIMAVAEILDEMTDGRVSMTTRFYEAERKIMWTSSVRRVLNLLVTGQFMYAGNPYLGELQLYFETYADLINFVYDTAVSEYRSLAAKLGKEPDEEFIQSGILSERSALKKMSMGHPYAHRDV